MERHSFSSKFILKIGFTFEKGHNMKKIIVGIIAIAAILALASVAVFSTSEKWQGKSADKQWKVIYEPAGILDDNWAGTLYWKGKGEVTLRNIQFIINGQSVLGFAEDEVMDAKIEDDWTFGDFGDKPKENSEVYVKITWEEANQSHTEKIYLEP